MQDVRDILHRRRDNAGLGDAPPRNLDTRIRRNRSAMA